MDDLSRNMHWFRWHHGSVTDPKFQLIAHKAGVRLGDVLVVWASLLEAASASVERGTFTEPDLETLDFLLGAYEGAAGKIIQAMKARGLIEGNRIVRWEVRQPKREREDSTAAERKRRQREREAEERAAAVGSGQDSSHHVTPASATSHTVTPRVDESREEEIRENTPPTPLTGGAVGVESAKPTKAGEICKAIKLRGVVDVNPSNPTLIELIAKGVPVETFEAAADTCAKAIPRKGMAYLLGIVKRELAEAAVIASGVGMPTKAWDTDRPSVEAKGVELGLGKWNEHDLSANRETFKQYEVRVRRAVEAMQGEPA